MTADPVLSDRPLGKSATLDEVIWFLDRQLTPFVRKLKSRVQENTGGLPSGASDDQVITYDAGTLSAVWSFISNANIAVGAAIDVLKLAAGLDNQVLVTNGTDAEWALLVDDNIDAAAGVQVSKLAAGTDGDVLTTVAGVPTWQVPATSGGFWEDRIDLDFAVLANQAFPTSGTPVSFGGWTWTPQAVSGGTNNGTINNVNGTGLQIAHNGNASTFGGSPTGPRLYAELKDLPVDLSDITEGPIRMQVQVSFNVLNADFQFFYSGLSTLQTEGVYQLCAIGYNSGDGGQTTAARVQHGGAGPDYYLNPAAKGSNDSVEMRFAHPFTMSYRFGQYSGGWPTTADPQGVIGSTLNSNVFGALTSFVQQRDNTLGAGAGNFGLRFVLGCATDAPGVAFTATVTRVRIQQWRDGS